MRALLFVAAGVLLVLAVRAIERARLPEFWKHGLFMLVVFLLLTVELVPQ